MTTLTPTAHKYLASDIADLQSQNDRLTAHNTELSAALQDIMETWQCNPDHYQDEIEKYGPLIKQRVHHG